MKRILVIAIATVLIGLESPLPSLGRLSKNPMHAVSGKDTLDWDEKIDVHHVWDKDVDKVFGPCESWKAACEKSFVPEPTERRYVQGYFKGMNQYVAVYDFIEVWCRTDPGKRKDDEFIYWRLCQFDKALSKEHVSGNKVRLLKRVIAKLLDYEDDTQWDLTFHYYLMQEFSEFYCRTLLREIPTSAQLRRALIKESKAWNRYRDDVESAYMLIEGSASGINGSSWDMEVCDFVKGNNEMRSVLLEDLLAITEESFQHQKPDAYIDNGMIQRERAKFSSNLDEDIDSFPINQRRKALNTEIASWFRWIDSLSAIRNLLPDSQKEYFDTSIQKVYRYKFIMLKNMYQGFGITSQSILDCLVPFDTDARGLYGPSFADKWKELTQ